MTVQAWTNGCGRSAGIAWIRFLDFAHSIVNAFTPELTITTYCLP
jgi:hypothetical protein